MALVVGLTGGIACGKSTVARLLAERGVPIVDADQVARDVVARGSDGLAAVKARFGDGVISNDGSLDRAALGRVVFGDDRARKELEAILHPRIGAESMRRVGEHIARGAKYVVYDAALLVENGTYKMFPELIVVACSEATQLARLVARDSLSEAEARARIAAQLPLERKVQVATIVIRNDADENALRREVDAAHARLSARAATGDDS